MLTILSSMAIGLALLAWGGDRFIVGASATARDLGVSPIIIGVTVVGFATSAPEMLVSALAAHSGTPGLAIGNAVGSNIANLGLVLGSAVLIQPLIATSKTLRRELPAMLAVTFAPLVLFVDGELGVIDSVILLLSLGGVIYWLTLLSFRASVLDPLRAEYEAEIPENVPMGKAVLGLAVGLTALLFGAEMLVFGGERAARALGISEVIIGLTIVAVGTSLPELAVSIAGARKNEPDLVLGNVIGSNIFNLLAVIGIAGIIAPHRFEPGVLSVHYPVMAGMTLAVFVLTYNRRRNRGQLGRTAGVAMLGSFAIYHAIIAWQALAT